MPCEVDASRTVDQGLIVPLVNGVHVDRVKPRIAIVMSHPIQHLCPQFVSLARSRLWEIRVLFASSAGAKPYFDKDFGREVLWAGLELSFDHRFLNRGRDVAIGRSIDAPELDAELEAFDPDAVLVYGYGKRLHRRAYAWARRNGKAIIYQADSELRHSRHLLKRALKRLFLPRYFRHVDAFLTVGDANERYLEYYGADARRFVRSGFPIDTQHFAQAYERRHALAESVRAKHALTEDEIVLCVVGKLIDMKAQAHVIEALRILDTSDLRLVLLVVGSGPDEVRLKELAQTVKAHRIIFSGFINVDELPAYYASAHIYVHPSRADAHSLSISEAIFMGCPLIVSDKCGSWGSMDDLRPGFNGLIFPTGDPQALAEVIMRLARHRELREWFGANSRTIAIASQEVIRENALQSALINLDLLYR